MYVYVNLFLFVCMCFVFVRSLILHSFALMFRSPHSLSALRLTLCTPKSSNWRARKRKWSRCF